MIMCDADIVVVDVCCILLCRCWQYDHGAKSHGWINLLTFVKDNGMVMIGPFEEEKFNESHVD